MGKDGLSERARVDAITRHFATGFSYSLQGAREQDELPLKRFLEISRSGHCEYFATATVLALRAVGIPARYATGYAVQEWGELEKAYVVRRRHAHAWALAYVDGAWKSLIQRQRPGCHSSQPTLMVARRLRCMAMVVAPVFQVALANGRGRRVPMDRPYRFAAGRSFDLAPTRARVEADADIANKPVTHPGENSPLLTITALYSVRDLGPDVAGTTKRLVSTSVSAGTFE